ncbi:MAG: patatin-like phospholipase family protein [Anaerolineales bacterium]|nr:patatin-like phospholipase family protein [Anaerolineales bacterium]
MQKCLAFVLGGGGARGAMQVGALCALIEAGIQPDLFVGTSIGAVNATGLAIWGIDLAGIGTLARAYQDIAEANIMDARLSQWMLRALTGQPNHHASRQIANFFISKGISPELQFNQISNIRLALIGADLDTGQPVIYGQDPFQSILDGLMASIALPPWFAPVRKDGHFIMDGGALSNLPIEPALTMGATEIIALDLDDPRIIPGRDNLFNLYFTKLAFALSRRHIKLETALAETRGVPIHCIALKSPEITPIWDFSNFRKLIHTGYEICRQEMSKMKAPCWNDKTLHTITTVN